MAAHVVAGLRNEAAFYATNLQGKTVPVHGGIWTASTIWGAVIMACRSVLLVHVGIRQSLDRRQESVDVDGAEFVLLGDLPLTIEWRVEEQGLFVGFVSQRTC
ncbi:hypothetical protein ARMGADRAFT_1028098 [Armillaria gallica]|uniref:Uncharacterized protein n=1 Tax=Armillaria gallica TaxID=47427 RepID=A0A2H3DY92_ARMGA|nr:hypothetical protein ARMGADRAFT_1028098 [Armillaria gallica]